LERGGRANAPFDRVGSGGNAARRKRVKVQGKGRDEVSLREEKHPLPAPSMGEFTRGTREDIYYEKGKCREGGEKRGRERGKNPGRRQGPTDVGLVRKVCPWTEGLCQDRKGKGIDREESIEEMVKDLFLG